MDPPTGIIVIWSGAVVNIPPDWTLCDGTLGTPDLRDRFIVGAGSTYAVGATGGSVNHNHTFTGDGHAHTIPADSEVASGADFSAATETNEATGTTNNGSSLPPYYALAYIMKL